MIHRNLLSLAFLVCVATAIAPAAAQQTNTSTPYVPTPQVTVDEMLRLAEVTDKDFVIDLGSGDGRLVITAARKFGARGLGMDINPELVAESEENARLAGVADRVQFVQQDFFKADISQATVVTMYLLPTVNMLLRPVLLGLKPGTRIVSHDFDLGDWTPDRKTTVRKNTFLWIVPAQVAGHWQIKLPLPPIERLIDLELTQRHQDVSGRARLNGVPTQLWEFMVTGDRVSFVMVDTTDRENEASLYFTGRVVGDVMEGEVTRGVGATRSTLRWRAVKAGT